MGITEIVVLAGSAADHEVKYREQCPELEVVYNVEDTLAPLDAQWLESFDNWVERARAEGIEALVRFQEYHPGGERIADAKRAIGELIRAGKQRLTAHAAQSGSAEASPGLAGMTALLDALAERHSRHRTDPNRARAFR